VFCIIDEQTRQPAESPVAAVLATGEPASLAERTSLISRDGRETPVADSAAAIHGRDGRITGMVLVFRDESVTRRAREQQRLRLNQQLHLHVEKLEHVTRALRTLSAGNRSMLHASDEADLLDSMCKAIVAAGSYRMACVWYRPDEPGAMLEPVAQSGHPGGIEALYRIRDQGGGNPEASTAIAAALRTGAPQVAQRLQEQAAYIPWHSEIAPYGACIANPLRVHGNVIGVMAIYSARDDDFSDDEAALLAESADDLAFGIATFRIRADQERIKQAMHRLTYYDEVTGLPNETRFAELVAAAIDAAGNGAPGFALLQANIERLREINEVLGFSHGDGLLKSFGARLQSVAPEGATVGRLRADEFAILLPASQADGAVALARRLDAALAHPFPVAGLPIEVAARIGISVFP
jgi:diguanylate cyclase (GGDEF)-like protein